MSYTAHRSAGAWHGELEWIVSIHEAPPARRVTGDSGILTVIHFGHSLSTHTSNNCHRIINQIGKIVSS